MKNLIKKITSLGILLFFALTAVAQEEYKVQLSSGGKVIIHNVNKVDIENHTGAEVIIQLNPKRKTKKDDRAKGLRAINGSGTTDNTRIGLSAVKKGNELTIDQVSKNSNGRFTIKIPQGISLLYEHGDHSAGDLNIRNFKSEIEVSAHYNNVRMINVSGPMSVNTVHGNIDAEFSTVNQTNPITIRSSHGLIDLSMPAATKANIKMRAKHGDMFTDFDIKATTEKDENDCNSCHTRSRVSGKINGGGVLMDLHSSHGNIYLRKKK